MPISTTNFSPPSSSNSTSSLSSKLPSSQSTSQSTSQLTSLSPSHSQSQHLSPSSPYPGQVLPTTITLVSSHSSDPTPDHSSSNQVSRHSPFPCQSPVTASFASTTQIVPARPLAFVASPRHTPSVITTITTPYTTSSLPYPPEAWPAWYSQFCTLSSDYTSIHSPFVTTCSSARLPKSLSTPLSSHSSASTQLSTPSCSSVPPPINHHHPLYTAPRSQDVFMAASVASEDAISFHLDRLPRELQHTIFQMLDYPSLLSLRQTNRVLYALVDPQIASTADKTAFVARAERDFSQHFPRRRLPLNTPAMTHHHGPKQWERRSEIPEPSHVQVQIVGQKRLRDEEEDQEQEQDRNRKRKRSQEVQHQKSTVSLDCHGFPTEHLCQNRESSQEPTPHTTEVLPEAVSNNGQESSVQEVVDTFSGSLKEGHTTTSDQIQAFVPPSTNTSTSTTTPPQAPTKIRTPPNTIDVVCRTADFDPDSDSDFDFDSDTDCDEFMHPGNFACYQCFRVRAPEHFDQHQAYQADLYYDPLGRQPSFWAPIPKEPYPCPSSSTPGPPSPPPDSRVVDRSYSRVDDAKDPLVPQADIQAEVQLQPQPVYSHRQPIAMTASPPATPPTRFLASPVVTHLSTHHPRYIHPPQGPSSKSTWPCVRMTLRRFCIDCGLQQGLHRPGDRLETHYTEESLWVCGCRKTHRLTTSSSGTRCAVCRTLAPDLKDAEW